MAYATGRVCAPARGLCVCVWLCGCAEVSPNSSLVSRYTTNVLVARTARNGGEAVTRGNPCFDCFIVNRATVGKDRDGIGRECLGGRVLLLTRATVCNVALPARARLGPHIEHLFFAISSPLRGGSAVDHAIASVDYQI